MRNLLGRIADPAMDTFAVSSTAATGEHFDFIGWDQVLLSAVGVVATDSLTVITLNVQTQSKYAAGSDATDSDWTILDSDNEVTMGKPIGDSDSNTPVANIVVDISGNGLNQGSVRAHAACSASDTVTLATWMTGYRRGGGKLPGTNPDATM